MTRQNAKLVLDIIKNISYACLVSYMYLILTNQDFLVEATYTVGMSNFVSNYAKRARYTCDKQIFSSPSYCSYTVTNGVLTAIKLIHLVLGVVTYIGIITALEEIEEKVVNRMPYYPENPAPVVEEAPRLVVAPLNQEMVARHRENPEAHLLMDAL